MNGSPHRTYAVRTLGCQMNAHDSERMAGLLEADGLVRAGSDAEADVIVFNTCAVRENADNRLYGNLGHLKDQVARQTYTPPALAQVACMLRGWEQTP